MNESRVQEQEGGPGRFLLSAPKIHSACCWEVKQTRRQATSLWPVFSLNICLTIVLVPADVFLELFFFFLFFFWH